MGRAITEALYEREISLGFPAEVPRCLGKRLVDELAQHQEIIIRTFDIGFFLLRFIEFDNECLNESSNHYRTSIEPLMLIAAVRLNDDLLEVCSRLPNDRKWQHLLGMRNWASREGFEPWLEN